MANVGDTGGIGGLGINSNTDENVGSTGVTSAPSNNNLQLINDIFDTYGANGGVWDFTSKTGLFQDSGATTPVTTSGDLIGFATDDRGNFNLTQGTAAAKGEWVANGNGLYGWKGIDAGDIMAATIAANVGNSSQFFAYVTTPDDTTNGWIAYTYQDGNNYQGLTHEAALGYRFFRRNAGGNSAVTVKADPTEGEEATLTYFWNSSTKYRGGKYNDEAEQATTGGFATGSFGNAFYFGSSFLSHIHRLVFIRAYLSDEDEATMQTIIQEGW
jgi:hypothetical protein